MAPRRNHRAAAPRFSECSIRSRRAHWVWVRVRCALMHRSTWCSWLVTSGATLSRARHLVRRRDLFVVRTRDEGRVAQKWPPASHPPSLFGACVAGPMIPRLRPRVREDRKVSARVLVAAASGAPARPVCVCGAHARRRASGREVASRPPPPVAKRAISKGPAPAHGNFKGPLTGGQKKTMVNFGLVL